MPGFMYGQGARNPDSSTGKVPVPHQNGQGARTPKSGKVPLLPNEQGARTPKGKALQAGALLFYFIPTKANDPFGTLTHFNTRYICNLTIPSQKKWSQFLVS